MTKLPVISGKKLIKALVKAEFYVHSQRGSHVKMKKIVGGDTIIVIVPNHKVVSKGTLRDIIKDAGLTVKEFNKLL
ncbi:MAG: type II toxin-antitoxin system HicA family toxin [Candidatus Hydrothermarchaeales archaeon]